MPLSFIGYRFSFDVMMFAVSFFILRHPKASEVFAKVLADGTMRLFVDLRLIAEGQ